METRRAAGTRAGRCRAGQSEPFDQRYYQPPGTAQQAVGATIPSIYDPRACSFVCDQVPCLFSRECNSKHLINIMSCCGNILWFEKCNTSEYAAGGHRPTRSDAAKQLIVCYLYTCDFLLDFIIKLNTASCATGAALPRVHIRPPERRRNFKKFSIPTRRFASAKEMFGVIVSSYVERSENFEFGNISSSA
ncbi:unnamed protein product [Nesidiocoris tenuis]|uniref:Uncharacterized protein n=1 Tax=Nesidiocoris tenuis TaxID=355587 RepID=A0A6H5HFM1_9HEMI|nr:unnamed protein product [Nesidiocoris tenuis]